MGRCCGGCGCVVQGDSVTGTGTPTDPYVVGGGGGGGSAPTSKIYVDGYLGLTVDSGVGTKFTGLDFTGFTPDHDIGTDITQEQELVAYFLGAVPPPYSKFIVNTAGLYAVSLFCSGGSFPEETDDTLMAYLGVSSANYYSQHPRGPLVKYGAPVGFEATVTATLYLEPDDFVVPVAIVQNPDQDFSIFSVAFAMARVS